MRDVHDIISQPYFRNKVIRRPLSCSLFLGCHVPNLWSTFSTRVYQIVSRLFYSTNTWKISIYLDIFRNTYHIYVKKEKERREQNLSNMQIYSCQAKFKGLQYFFLVPKIRFILLKMLSVAQLCDVRCNHPSHSSHSTSITSHSGRFQSLERHALSWPWTFVPPLPPHAHTPASHFTWITPF